MKMFKSNTKKFKSNLENVQNQICPSLNQTQKTLNKLSQIKLNLWRLNKATFKQPQKLGKMYMLWWENEICQKQPSQVV